MVKKTVVHCLNLGERHRAILVQETENHKLHLNFEGKDAITNGGVSDFSQMAHHRENPPKWVGHTPDNTPNHRPKAITFLNALPARMMEDRTPDLRVRSAILYPLSYGRGNSVF